MRRTDTTKKALVSGFLLKAAGYEIPYVVLTSHLPVVDSAGDVMMQLALKTGAVAAVICVNDVGFAQRLEQAARIN